MIHSRFCSGDDEYGGCDCDGIMAAGSAPLPYVGCGMVVRVRGIALAHRSSVWLVDNIYEDGDTTMVRLCGHAPTDSSVVLTLPAALVRAHGELAIDYDPHPDAIEAQALREIDEGDADVH